MGKQCILLTNITMSMFSLITNSFFKIRKGISLEQRQRAESILEAGMTVTDVYRFPFIHHIKTSDPLTYQWSR